MKEHKYNSHRYTLTSCKNWSQAGVNTRALRECACVKLLDSDWSAGGRSLRQNFENSKATVRITWRKLFQEEEEEEKKKKKRPPMAVCGAGKGESESS